MSDSRKRDRMKSDNDASTISVHQEVRLHFDTVHPTSRSLLMGDVLLISIVAVSNRSFFLFI